VWAGVGDGLSAATASSSFCLAFNKAGVRLKKCFVLDAHELKIPLVLRPFASLGPSFTGFVITRTSVLQTFLEENTTVMMSLSSAVVNK